MVQAGYTSIYSVILRHFTNTKMEPQLFSERRFFFFFFLKIFGGAKWNMKHSSYFVFLLTEKDGDFGCNDNEKEGIC